MSTSILIRLDETANAGNVAVSTVSVAAFCLLWVYVANRVSRHDPARKTFAVWMQILLPLQVVLAVLYLSESATKVQDGYLPRPEPNRDHPWRSWGYSNSRYYQTDRPQLAVKLARISGLVNLFSRLADAIILIIFFELGHGFMYARLRTATVYRSVLRSLSVAIALVAAVTALVSAGVYFANVESWLEEMNEYPEYWRLNNFSTYANATVAADVLRWAATLPAIAYAAHVVRVWMGQSIRLTTARYLLATVIMFLRCFTFIGFEGTLGPDLSPASPEAAQGTFRGSSDWASIKYAANVLSWVFFVIVTGILVNIGGKKKDGLWTTKQPFHVDFSPIPHPVVGNSGRPSTALMSQTNATDDERTIISDGSRDSNATRYDGGSRV
ncbi:hypothetical protein PpBr36_08757 [Pyricularia pennisetigena]|uniref:hypothetical protein n=1 Tax=Pyricularia pennisetigena TaxID=1578925 RepID=UPI00114E6DD8|nr:hypothetical protein PpBr36_08757 [Pyricularia pennisetigena]TLS24298.1 hypothetical protein PpBr36_08757 [Pyricularia pennisetigena]